MHHLLFISLLVLLPACSQEVTKEPPVADVQSYGDFKKNLDQDMNELSDQVKRDYGVLEQQVKEDSAQVQENWGKDISRGANQMRDNIKKTGRKLREWWLTPLPDPQPTPLATSYCYTSFQDVLCYRQPVPGWEHRLLAYQGTGAAPPPPSITKPVPLAGDDQSKLAVNRVANSKPVFVTMPEDAKAEKQDDDQPSVIPADSLHETLPDPALAPQL